MPRARDLVLLAALVASASASARQPAATTAPPPKPQAAPAAAEPVTAPAADVGYALGYRIGTNIKGDHENMGLDIDRAALARGLADAVTGAKPTLGEADFAKAVAAFEATLAQRRAAFAARMQEAAQKNLAKGREFLAANAKRPGVVVRPSGLQYEVVKEGGGPAPGPDDIVVARYRGTRLDGTEFDATDPQGEPATFRLRDVVAGWREALPLMKAGTTWRIWLPPDLAYGAQGEPPVIEPNEVLVFELELIESKAGPKER